MTAGTSPTRVVLLACDGMYQRDLAALLAARFQLAGIVWHSSPGARGPVFTRLRRYANPVKLLRHLAARLALRRSKVCARPLVERLFPAQREAPTLSDVPATTVQDINAAPAVDFVRRIRPDIVCVNGTNLLREPMLALAPAIPLGIINLHTGLSPYSRGGNCDLFMLLEGHPELVGVTIHHIDPGIDSGDLIITARPELAPEDNYEMIEAKAFRLGNDLMAAAVRQLVEGRAQRVPQWTEGKLFLRRTGYVYEPYHRLRVDRMLARGLVAHYLQHKHERDAGIRLVGELA